MSKPVLEDVFRFSGRRNRKSFILYVIMQLVIIVAVWLVFMVGMATKNEAATGTAVLILLLPFAALCISGWAVSAQRCRDFGWTRWATLIALVPVVGWIFSVALYFAPGDEGDNRYGPSPLAR